MSQSKSMPGNKNHWYDGIFYDVVIAPNQDKSFSHVKNIIEPNSTLIDVGCGTGRLAFQIADKCRKVDALDLSKRNIDLANKKLAKNSKNNIQFIHADVLNHLNGTNQKYDYAVLSYVIHEIDESLREQILKELSKAAEKIIVIDYLAPRTKGMWSLLNEIIEYVAGREHYSNFKTFIAGNGIKGLSKRTGLKIVNEIKDNPATSHLVVLEK
ncbi:MAG: class I SAM-dependent methyltransferase [Ignavibacteriaceae bacterium]|nr:class I SAM-dependent methyltransferase [Ignavibacteriaceae bacterium]